MRSAKYAIVSSEYCHKLEHIPNYVRIIPVSKNEYLTDAVSCHADMNFLNFGDVLFAAGGAEVNEDLFRIRNIQRLCNPGARYPDDVICNAKIVGKHLFCNVRTIDKSIIEYARNKNFQILNVKQGYTGCSICKVSDKAIITSDTGITAVAEQCGIDVLLIDNRDIKLPGYDVGFIGGCTGLLDQNKLLFTGSVSRCSFGRDMTEFCGKHGVDIIELIDGAPIDVGGILVL